ncbi:hypothetical protein [Gallaecimonas sp. GXIMD1310]|uniref:hypothetical protein n=1 Tax=Gallaecimonas sp. GXIMD1310 TaxID=3131926 RepID=UPI00324CD0EE
MPDFTKDQQDSNEVGFYQTPVMTETLHACWSLGPLEVCAKMVGPEKIDITVKLAGITIGSGTLDAGNTKVCASANVGLAKASVCAVADFPNKNVYVEGKLCHREWTGGWSCKSFKATLISW